MPYPIRMMWIPPWTTQMSSSSPLTPSTNKFEPLMWLLPTKSKTDLPVTPWSFRQSTRWRRNSPSSTNPMLRIGYYRSLETLTIFHPSTISTIPTTVGHDYKWQRDLYGDMGAVHMWWCSEHHLLRLSLTAFLPCLFHFHLRLIYILVSMIMPLYQHDYAFLLPHNYTYPILSFLLTITDIASSAVLSLCAASFSLISTFSLIVLPALKALIPIYTGLLLQLYFNLDLYNLPCSSIFLLLWSPLLLEALLLTLGRTPPPSTFLCP